MEQDFQATVLGYYKKNKRSLSWRTPVIKNRMDPYKIMVSEIMLQQTQASRVENKYKQFLEKFPTVHSLAVASLSDVLEVWQGLGYNRRAKYLRDAAVKIVAEYGGMLPDDSSALTKLPGIGPNTAAAIVVYSYDKPAVFIETNIRAVYIYHFFTNQNKVTDKQILELVNRTLPADNFREWYWALMDYGTYIKKQFGSHNSHSKHYAKQSTFHGSKRQVRGQVLRELSHGPLNTSMLSASIQDERLKDVLDDLLHEKLIQYDGNIYRVAD